MVDEFTHDWISNGFDSIEIKMIYDIWYFNFFMIYDILKIYVKIALAILFYLLCICLLY